MQKRFFLSLFLLFPFLSFANSIDSLNQVLEQADLEPIQKVKTYNALAKAYIFLSTDSATKYNDLAMSVAKELPPSRDKINAYLGQASIFNGRYESAKARVAATEALRLSKELDDKKMEGLSLKSLGLALKNATQYDSAKVVIRQAIDMARASGDLGTESVSENVMAQIFSRQQAYDSSLLHYRASILLGEKAGNFKDNLAPMYNMGIVYYNLGTFDSTMAIMYKITKVAGRLNGKRIQGAAHSVIANMYSAEGKLDSALIHIEKGISIADSLSVDRMYGYYNLADIYMKERNYDASLGYWKLALGQAVGINSIAQADMLKGLGEFFLDWDKLDSAVYYLDLSEARAKKFGSSETLGKLRLLRAQALGKQQKYAEAIATIGPALEAKEIAIASSGYFNKGGFHKKLGEFTLARPAYLKALELFKQSDQTRDIALAYYNLAICDSALGNSKGAFKYMSLYAREEGGRLKERYKESVAEFETKFETAQKEAQIKSLEQDKRIQDLEIAQTTAQRNTLLAIALTLLLAGGAIFALFVRIRQQREALLKANATKDRLFSIISHDLRGPVTGLQTAGKIFTHHIEKGNLEVLKAISSQVDQQAGQVRRLLDNLLTWSLQQLGVYESKVETFAFEPFGKDILAYYQQAATAKGLEMRLEADPDLRLKADRRGLSIILTNLVNNAVKFTEEGEVVLSARQEGNKTLLAVRDTGVGMPPDTLALLQKGEMAGTERGTRGEKGTGLGWQIIRELVDRWKGELKVESEKRVGTKVEIRL